MVLTPLSLGIMVGFCVIEALLYIKMSVTYFRTVMERGLYYDEKQYAPKGVKA